MPDEGKSTDTFLYIEGIDGKPIKGDCVDKAHPDEIQLQSYDMNISADKPEKPGPKDLWHPNFHPLSLVVVMSRASPSFFKAVCVGSKFRRLFIFSRKRGAQNDYLQWRFSDVQVVDYSLKLNDDKPEETIKVDYQEIEMYFARQGATGELIDATSRSWSRYTNKESTTTILPFDPKKGTSVYT